MLYQRKKILLATKHAKEQVIKPAFESHLGCLVELADSYDTDQFGTFSGEISRTLSARDTCIQKARVAMTQMGYRYAIASEGSFGQHPYIPFCPSDTELLVFIDSERDLIIDEYLISTKTNYAYIDLAKNQPYDDFLQSAIFPSHALIVRALDSNRIIAKGVLDEASLKSWLAEAFCETERVRLETDMRAMMNPTRMGVIKELAIQLVERINTICGECASPGFGQKSTEGQLRCEQCGADTKLYMSLVLSCLKCTHKVYLPRKDGLLKADPAYCQCCNP